MTGPTNAAPPPASGPDFDVAGRTVLVTGASGGLGAHFASLLAGRGARVAACARRLDPLRRLADDVARTGGTLAPFALDVTDPASVDACVDAVGERFGRIDVLVNNAGVTASAPALDLAVDDFDAVLGTNLRGAWLVARAVARRMRDGDAADAADAGTTGTTGATGATGRGGEVDGPRGGSIVNVASILGLRVAGNVAAYAASKAALVQLTKALALEWARHGIRVNALAPGYVETDLNRAFFASDAGRRLVARIPQRRLGQPHELDGPLLLLASDASAYMTGTTLVCDGGHLVSSL